MGFHTHKLSNGLQIVGETSPTARSVALGFVVRTGSRDETPQESGVTHFLEHMIFKGTERRTYLDVNRDFDRIGADYNAFTSEESTVFHAAILPEYLPTAVDLLSDILRPSLREQDFDMEKNVILEEIGMYEDRPASIAFDYAKQVYYAEHNLGNSILGTPESVTALTQKQMIDYFRRRYVAPNITVAAAGNFDWPEMVELIEKHCGHWEEGPIGRAGLTEARGTGAVKVMQRDKVTQEHVILMSPGPSISDPIRFAADTLGVAYGDDSGSRLFWALIVPGLVDSVGAGYHQSEGTGLLYTYYSSEPDRAGEVLDVVKKTMADLQEKGITQEELDQAKSKIQSALVRRSERPMGRMLDLGMSWSYLGEHRSIDDDLRDYDAVTLDDIRRVLDRFPVTEMTTFALGPLDKL